MQESRPGRFIIIEGGLDPASAEKLNTQLFRVIARYVGRHRRADRLVDAIQQRLARRGGVRLVHSKAKRKPATLLRGVDPADAEQGEASRWN